MRPSHPNGPRTKDVNVHYSPAEWERVVERAEAAGKKPRTYIREVSLGRLPRTRFTIIRGLGRAALALKELAATARAAGAPAQTARIEAALADVFAFVRRVG